jgi:hypothetical protein
MIDLAPNVDAQAKLRHMTIQPPLVLFGHVGLGQTPSIMLVTSTVVPRGHASSGGW